MSCVLVAHLPYGYRYIPDLVRKMEEGGHDVVSGTRYGLGGGVRMGFRTPAAIVVLSLSSTAAAAASLLFPLGRARAAICRWR